MRASDANAQFTADAFLREHDHWACAHAGVHRGASIVMFREHPTDMSMLLLYNTFGPAFFVDQKVSSRTLE